MVRPACLTALLLAASAFAGDGHPTHQHSSECHHPPTAATPASTSAEEVVRRGGALKGAPKVTLESLLAEPQRHAGKTVQLTGKVRKACTKKGCWMELAPRAEGAGVRVTFKDYGFFVPLDSAGRSAVVEGVVSVTELSDGRAKHYESEGATVLRDGHGKVREVQLVASAVELRK